MLRRYGASGMIALTLSVAGFIIAAQAQEAAAPTWLLLSQKLTVDGVAVTASVTRPVQNNFLILFQFQSSTFPVGCLSSYRDIQYELLDAQGHIVPIDQRAVEHLQQEQSVVNHVIAGATGHPCASNAPTGVWSARASFFTLYPNMPPGKYTLRITFAPRGTDSRASFAPVHFSIAPPIPASP